MTPEVRAWLGRHQSLDGPYLYDFVLDFMRAFELDSGVAADLVAQWIRETM